MSTIRYHIKILVFFIQKQVFFISKKLNKLEKDILEMFQSVHKNQELLTNYEHRVLKIKSILTLPPTHKELHNWP